MLICENVVHTNEFQTFSPFDQIYSKFILSRITWLMIGLGGSWCFTGVIGVWRSGNSLEDRFSTLPEVLFLSLNLKTTESSTIFLS